MGPFSKGNAANRGAKYGRALERQHARMGRHSKSMGKAARAYHALSKQLRMSFKQYRQTGKTQNVSISAKLTRVESRMLAERLFGNKFNPRTGKKGQDVFTVTSSAKSLTYRGPTAKTSRYSVTGMQSNFTIQDRSINKTAVNVHVDIVN